MKYILSIFLFCSTIFANDINVTIIYGNGLPDRIIKTTYENGITALELLKKVADIETSKTGKFNFVRSIDGIKSEVGLYGWFYFIDDKSTNKMAENYKLENNKRMTWYMNKEECN